MSIVNYIFTAIATLGVGKISLAPGTWGSAFAMLVWWALNPLSVFIQLVLIFLAFFIGWVGTHFYERANNKHDPKEVVVDELIGMWITLIAAPRILWVYALGFLFFRIFDIWKPFPVGWIDRQVPGALGTILDDIAAGIIALILMQFVLYWGGMTTLVSF